MIELGQRHGQVKGVAPLQISEQDRILGPKFIEQMADNDVFIEGHGFALPDADFLVEFSSAGPGEMQTVSVRVIPEGYFAELETRMVLRLPGMLFDSTRIENVAVKTESGENW